MWPSFGASISPLQYPLFRQWFTPHARFYRRRFLFLVEGFHVPEARVDSPQIVRVQKLLPKIIRFAWRSVLPRKTYVTPNHDSTPSDPFFDHCTPSADSMIEHAILLVKKEPAGNSRALLRLLSHRGNQRIAVHRWKSEKHLSFLSTLKIKAAKLCFRAPSVSSYCTNFDCVSCLSTTNSRKRSSTV